jgi:hypothetical protein
MQEGCMKDLSSYLLLCGSLVKTYIEIEGLTILKIKAIVE